MVEIFRGAGGRGEGCLRASDELTDAIYKGLNVEREIRAVDIQGLGDTVLLWDNYKLIELSVT